MNVTINDTVNGTINHDVNGTINHDISIPGLLVLLIFLAVSFPFVDFFRYHCITNYRHKIYIDDENHDTTAETNTEYE